MSIAVNQSNGQRAFRVPQFSEKHGIPIGGLRHLIFNEKENGFHKVTRRVGKAVYIIEEDYFRWLDEINGITPQ